MKALIVVDMQNDFLPGGNLCVPNGDEIIPVINALQSRYELVVATQDWHPAVHKSFASQYSQYKEFDVISIKGIQQTLWPDHCIQGSFGAQFSDLLDQVRFEGIFRKGTNVNVDSYSGFYDNSRQRNTGLHGYLSDRGVTEVHICGLAADYCVYYTAIDALALGYKTAIVSKATKAIDKDSYMTKKQYFINAGGTFI